MDKGENFLRRIGARFVFDARVNVLGVLAKNRHFDFFRMFHGRRNPFELAYGAQTNVKIQHLPERDVQRTNAATDRSGQWTLDRNEIMFQRRERVFGKPILELVESLLARINLKPLNLAFSSVSLLTAASKTAFEERQISGPVPSPSMKGITGFSGTCSFPFLMEMASPEVGALRFLNCGAFGIVGLTLLRAFEIDLS